MVDSQAPEKKWLLLGCPNVGKTSLFNQLTLSQKPVVNFAGSTSSAHCGGLAHSESPVVVYDTPGVVDWRHPVQDEKITLDLLKCLGEQTPAQISVIYTLDPRKLVRDVPVLFALSKRKVSFCVVLTHTEKISGSQLNEASQWITLLTGKTPIVAPKRQSRDQLIQSIQLELSRTLESRPGLRLFWELEPGEIKTVENLQTQVPNWDSSETSKFNQKMDSWILSPGLGWIFFVGIHFLFFSSVFWIADYPMTWIETTLAYLQDGLQSYLLSGHFPAPKILVSLVDLVLTGFSSFLVFVPQIAILFFGLSLFEQSGYMSRASILIDGPLRKIFLSGKSFAPVLSGFACAIPAYYAARQIADRREKFKVYFLLPLLTCSARLPVYTLVIALILNQFGLSGLAGGAILSALYFFSLITFAATAMILEAKFFQRFLPPVEPSGFVIELPDYEWPKISQALKSGLRQGFEFVYRAGLPIFVCSSLIWVLSHFPEGDFSQSYLARIGHWVEPLFAPMGVDWKVGVAILSSFAAREVFVSTLAVLMSVSEEGLGQEMIATGSALTLPASLGLLVFFSIALQCVSTLVVAFKETRSRAFVVVQFLVYNILAYALAVTVYKGMSSWL